MGVRESLKVLERVAEIATLAGIKGEVNDEAMHYALGVSLDQGRTQGVFVRDTSRDPERPIVTIFSPCLVVKKGLFSGISKNAALDLLRLNEAIHFARYGIHETDKESMIVASIDHLLDTLDPQEFEASIFHVAIAADQYERKFGQDVF